MDFLNDFISKAKETLDFACKKTGEVVSVQKQKIDVVALTNKRNKDFEALGKLYFELYSDSESQNEEIAALISEINRKNEMINQINDEINATKSLIVCPKCNNVIKDDSSFCNKCGAKLDWKDEN